MAGQRGTRGQACTFVGLQEEDSRVPRDCFLAAMDDKVGWRKRAMGGRVGDWEEGQLRST